MNNQICFGQVQTCKLSLYTFHLEYQKRIFIESFTDDGNKNQTI